MQKWMGCKAEGEVQYRSNLMVVRIWTNPTTKQRAISAPRPVILFGRSIHFRTTHTPKHKWFGRDYSIRSKSNIT